MSCAANASRDPRGEGWCSEKSPPVSTKRRSTRPMASPEICGLCSLESRSRNPERPRTSRPQPSRCRRTPITIRCRQAYLLGSPTTSSCPFLFLAKYRSSTNLTQPDATSTAAEPPTATWRWSLARPRSSHRSPSPTPAGTTSAPPSIRSPSSSVSPSMAKPMSRPQPPSAPCIPGH